MSVMALYLVALKLKLIDTDCERSYRRKKVEVYFTENTRIRKFTISISRPSFFVLGFFASLSFQSLLLPYFLNLLNVASLN